MAEIVAMKHIGGPVPRDLANDLKQIADANERSLSAELRIAIREYVESHTEEQAA